VTAGSTYLYDGDGKRVQKSNGKLYWYGMNGDPLDETDAQGSTNNSNFNEYIFFDGRRIARRDYQSNVFYYFADHLGTARVATNSSGVVCYDADFYPFGGERIVTDTCDSAYKFTGKERDSESGLDNFGARYDSSSMGRFMSADPVFISAARLTDPQSLNLYAYVRNNPLNLTDPTGLDFYLSCTHTDDNASTCQQVQNGSSKDWVQGQTVNGQFQATDVDMNDPKDTSAGYHDQFGNQYTGTFDQNNGVSFTNTANGDTSGHSRFIDGSDQTNVNGGGAFTGIEGRFFSDCGGSCEARGSLYGSASAFANAEAALHKQSGFMSALDLLSGAHKAGSQWKDSSGYVHMLNPSGQMELHFEGHPTGVDVQQFVLHMVDTIRDATSGRAAAEKNAPLP
jgi:RHS repeat-associated protein